MPGPLPFAASQWRTTVAALLCIATVACSSAPAGAPAEPAPRTVDAVARLRAAVQLARMRGEGPGRAHAGGSVTLVFDTADIARVRAALERRPEDGVELAALYRFLLAEWLERERPELGDELGVVALHEALAERARRHRRIAHALGFPSVPELGAALHGSPPPATELARAVLRASSALYTASVAELNGRSDLAVVLAGDPIGDDLDAADVDDRARAALERMGLPAPEALVGSSVPGLGTAAIVLREGGAVSVRLPAIGGGRGLAAAVTGVATALRWAQSPPPLVHSSLVESHDPWPAIWARLGGDRRWIRAAGGVDAGVAAQWEQLATVAELVALRRDAALALIDAELAAGTPESVADVIRRAAARAFGPGRGGGVLRAALLELVRSPPFAVAARLRTRVIASRLTTELVARSGPCWWSDPRSGAWIREAWSHPGGAVALGEPPPAAAPDVPAAAPNDTSPDDAPRAEPPPASSGPARDAEQILRPLAERLASRDDARPCPDAPSS